LAFSANQVLVYFGGEHELRGHIDKALTELASALDTVFPTSQKDVFVSLVCKFQLADHHGLGVLLSKRMGQAHDRCPWSRSDLVVAKNVAYFERPEFYLTKHIQTYNKICTKVLEIMQDRESKGLPLNKTSYAKAIADARLLYGNFTQEPILAQSVGPTAPLLKYLGETMLSVPIFHIQVSAVRPSS
jgi:hypothetical protein